MNQIMQGFKEEQINSKGEVVPINQQAKRIID